MVLCANHLDLILGNLIRENYQGWVKQVMSLHPSIVHVCENAEAVALLQGSETERELAFHCQDSCFSHAAIYQKGLRYCKYLFECFLPLVSGLLLQRVFGGLVSMDMLNIQQMTALEGSLVWFFPAIRS